MYNFVSGFVGMPGNSAVFSSWFFPFVFLLAIWGIVWKGLALWISARRGEKWWFVACLVINTLGILEILYIFVFSKNKGDNIIDNLKAATNEPVVPIAHPPTESSINSQNDQK